MDAKGNRMIKVEVLLPKKTRTNIKIDENYIKSVIERIATEEGGATSSQAPVDGLWFKKEEGRLVKDELIGFYVVISLRDRERSIYKHLQILKQKLEKEFAQDDIFMIAAEVQRIV